MSHVTISAPPTHLYDNYCEPTHNFTVSNIKTTKILLSVSG